MIMNRDGLGIICQPQPDGSLEGGDGACWTGHWVYLTGSDYPYPETFEVGFGAYVRHPEKRMTYHGFGAHYRHPWEGCMSRDQLTGVLAALIGRDDRRAMLRLFANHSLRLFLFAYNTRKNGRPPADTPWKLPDLTLLDFWATALRGFGRLSWLAWPLLALMDLQLLLNALITNREETDDQINFAVKLMIANERVPTPTSRLALAVTDKPRLLAKIDSYWGGWRRNPGMAELYRIKMSRIAKNPRLLGIGRA
jgi:hypothetical protein